MNKKYWLKEGYVTFKNKKWLLEIEGIRNESEEVIGMVNNEENVGVNDWVDVVFRS